MKDHQIKSWGGNFAIVARTETTDAGPVGRWVLISKHDKHRDAELALKRINDSDKY